MTVSMNEYLTIMKHEHIIELECKFTRVMRRVWQTSRGGATPS